MIEVIDDDVARALAEDLDRQLAELTETPPA
jgi:hypothetical protein